MLEVVVENGIKDKGFWMENGLFIEMRLCEEYMRVGKVKCGLV